MLRRLLFGYDFFISYARNDASPYAEALAKSLSIRKFKCFLDRSEFSAGPAFKRRLRQAIKSSSSLILICTEGAIRSPHVRYEVETFAATRRQIIPITVGDAFPVDAWPIVAGRDFAWLTEDISRVRDGEPTDSIVDEVQQSLALTRREVIRFRVMGSTIIVLSILLLLALYFWRDAVRQETIARAGQLAANAQLVLTERPASLDLATLLAVESMRRAPSLDNDIALRTPLRLLPALIHRSTFEQVVIAVRWTPDGQYLIVAAGPSVTVFDRSGERQVATFTHDEPINTIALSSDGMFLGNTAKVTLCL